MGRGLPNAARIENETRNFPVIFDGQGLSEDGLNGAVRRSKSLKILGFALFPLHPLSRVFVPSLYKWRKGEESGDEGEQGEVRCDKKSG